MRIDQRLPPETLESAAWVGLLVGVVPSVSSEAFERWEESLRVAGFEVQVEVSDHELAMGTVRKGIRKVHVGLPRRTDGRADLFVRGFCLGRRGFRDSILEALEARADPE